MTSHSKNAQCDVFGFLTHSKIFITFEGGKKRKALFFNALALCILNNFSDKFWAKIYMLPLLFFFKTCRIGIHFSFIFFLYYWILTNMVLFFPQKKNLLGKFHKTYFFNQNAYLHTIQKKKKIWAVLSESWRRQNFKTPWTYTMTKKFEKEIILKT